MTYFEELTQDDWLKRNDAYYTNRIGSSEWEDRVKKGQPYCFAFFRPARNAPFELRLLQSRQQCQGVVDAMRPPHIKRINLVYGKKANHTDMTTFIELNPEPLSNTGGRSPGHQMDVMVGLAVHEMAHVLHTVAADYSANIRAKPKRGEQELLGWIQNLIEDERIENLVGRTMPGYVLFLGSTKHYMFEHKIKEKLAELEQAEVEGKVKVEAQPLNSIMSQLMLMIRYPKMLDAALVEEYEVVLRECQAAMTPYPETHQQMLDTANRVYDILLKYYADLAAEENWPVPEEMTLGEFMGMLLAGLFEMMAQADPTQTKEDLPEVPGMAKKAIQKALDKLNEMSQEDVAEQQDQTEQLGLDEDTQTGSIPVRVEDKSKRGDRHAYDQSLQRVQPYATNLRAQMARFNRRTSERVVGLDEGTLNVEELVAARLGTKNVYEQQKRTRNNGASIGLLVDESGSMSGTNIERARDIAVLFERALTGLHGIDFYAYGHTTGYDTSHSGDEATLIHRYFEGYKKGDRYCLGQIAAHSANRDGHALLQVAGRMRKLTQQPIVLFVISDGQPVCSTPPGFTPVSYTKHAAEQLQKRGIHVIHVGITNAVRSELMFKDFVKFTNLSTLAKELGDLLRKVVTKIQQPVVTIED